MEWCSQAVGQKRLLAEAIITQRNNQWGESAQVHKGTVQLNFYAFVYLDQTGQPPVRCRARSSRW